MAETNTAAVHTAKAPPITFATNVPTFADRVAAVSSSSIPFR